MDPKKLMSRLQQRSAGDDPFAPPNAQEPFPHHAEEVFCVDKDRQVDTYGGELKVIQDVSQAKCASCGAPTRYDPEVKALLCDHCGSMVRVEASAAVERDLVLGRDTSGRWREETHVFRCGNCGATTVFDKNEIATKCPFCGSPSVVDTSDIEGVRPNAVVPFAISAEKASSLYARWIRSRAFAPGVFKKKRLRHAQGVYIPGWTFDSATTSYYSATVGDYYTVTVGSGQNRRTETRVRYRSVSGVYRSTFDDILIHAGRETEPKQFNRICPFPTQNASSYNAAFLAGYSAEHYTVTLSQGWELAQSQMRSVIDREIRRQLSRTCDVIQSMHFSTDFSGNKFKYTLLPVYVLHHEFKTKNYKFFVNGVGGKVSGDYPKSVPKILATVFAALLAVAGIVIGALFGVGIL